MPAAPPPPPGRAPAKSEARRTVLIDRIADILLEEGVALIPLRDLARRLGTSDRMLLYYFETQAALITATLGRLSERLSAELEGVASGGRLAPAPLLSAVSGALAQPAIARTLAVWADVTARGARGEAPFRAVAGASVAAWIAWADARLDVADEAERARLAAALLVVVEGVRLIETSAPGTTQGVIEILAKAFEV